MTKSEFYEIVNMDDMCVSIQNTSHFSIGTSPYYAHQHGLAIDIYQNLNIDNYEVFSPVSGKILKVKTLAAPKAKFLDGIDKDYLILISNPSNSELLWKLMHVKPDVKAGDQITVGDSLGKTIRNGYFAYWSSPHIHLEIRAINDAIRARGGKSFLLAIEKKGNSREFFEAVDTTQIPIEIHSVYPEIILANLPKHFYHKISPIYGVKARINNLNCILDGGIPHYKLGTVIFRQEYNSDIFPPVYLGITEIGTLHEKNRQFAIFKFANFKLLLNDKEIRGISLYLANFLPLIKIIPYNKSELSFKPKSTQNLSIIVEET